MRGRTVDRATGAYGLALSLRADPSDEGLDKAHASLLATRPTAVNLRWSLDRVRDAVRNRPRSERADAAWREAAAICDEDVETCHRIGKHGFDLLRGIAEKNPLTSLTHCNSAAALSIGHGACPIYMATTRHQLHFWVDELTAQSCASFTASLYAGLRTSSAEIPRSLMQRVGVPRPFVGADRVTRNGDVANRSARIGKRSRHGQDVPFNVALPSTTIDGTLDSGDTIRSRSAARARYSRPGVYRRTLGHCRDHPSGSLLSIQGFDVTPARLGTGFITTRALRATKMACGLVPDVHGRDIRMNSLCEPKRRAISHAMAIRIAPIRAALLHHGLLVGNPALVLHAAATQVRRRPGLRGDQSTHLRQVSGWTVRHRPPDACREVAPLRRLLALEIFRRRHGHYQRVNCSIRRRPIPRGNVVAAFCAKFAITPTRPQSGADRPACG